MTKNILFIDMPCLSLVKIFYPFITQTGATMCGIEQAIKAGIFESLMVTIFPD